MNEIKMKGITEQNVYQRVKTYLRSYAPDHTLSKSGEDWYLLKGEDVVGCFTAAEIGKHFRLLKPWETVAPDSFYK